MFKNTINKVFILGYLGETPTLKYTTNNIPNVIINIATNDTYKDKDNTFKKRTEWHRVICYNNIAESIANFTEKGSLVFIEGYIKTNTWTHENQTKSIKNIIASNIQIMDNKKTQHEKLTKEKNDEQEEFISFDDKTPF